MSKKIQANITCPGCQNQQNFSLYRTLWIEYPVNLDLVFADKVNYFICNSCGYEERLKFPLLCTNAERKFAVWYEPYHDEQIDIDCDLYKKHMGEDSYFARAPRIKNWDKFKKKILELQKNKNEGNVSFSEGASLAFQNFVNDINKSEKRFNSFVRSLNPIPILISAVFLFIPIFDFLGNGHIDLDGGFFTLLRIIVFGTFCYLAWFYYQAKEETFLLKIKNELVVWVLGFGAIVFNPFIQIHFEEEAWVFIGVCQKKCVNGCNLY